jgi:hypothetical protein
MGSWVEAKDSHLCLEVVLFSIIPGIEASENPGFTFGLRESNDDGRDWGGLASLLYSASTLPVTIYIDDK